MEGGEGEKPKLEVVPPGEFKPASKEEEDTVSIIRGQRKKFSRLPFNQAEVLREVFEKGFDVAIAQSELPPDEFRRLFNEGNATLYGEPQAPKASDKPGHPSSSRESKAEPAPTTNAEIIPFPKPPAVKPPQP